MPIEFAEKITKDDLRANRDKHYVFGDNIARRGFGGQAKEMRFEPNAIGIVTKHNPGTAEEDYFSDSLSEIRAITDDLKIVECLLLTKHTVVVPQAGIGTGRAELATRSPVALSVIRVFFEQWSRQKLLWGTR